MESANYSAQQGSVSFERTDDSTLVIHLTGGWHLRRDMPSAAAIAREIGVLPAPRTVSFDASGLTGWDSGLVSFVADISESCRARGIADDRSGLPAGVRRLLELAQAVPEKQGARAQRARIPFFQRVGEATIGYGISVGEALTFLGDITIAGGKLLRGKARYRRIDLLENIQSCGANAVGIVTLISFLVGVILAFMGAVQLQQFGASIYVADLVAIGMVREMGAMMTAIIMSGRTGAAFAAQLGTMKVTQEVDALSTMGISPLEFLVIPRLTALVLMMPLLCLYSDMMGIAGGAAIGMGMLGLSPTMYIRETISALSLANVFLGLIKATAYGALIAIAGCLQGFRCGSSSSAVGDAATQAVVSSIVLVVVACGLFAVITNLLHV